MLADIFDELRAVEQWASNAERANAAAARWSPRQVENMQLAAQMWPDLAPGALLALGSGNYAPDHPMARQLAEVSAMYRMRNHPYGAAYGQESVTPAMSAEARRALNARNARAGQEDYARRRGMLTPGQGRLLDSEPKGLDPHSDNVVEAARARGIIRDDGTIVRPVERKFDNGEWSYDSPFAEETDRLFQEVMGALAEQQGTDDPIPFTWGAQTGDAGQQGSYYPKTGNTDVVSRGGEVVADLPGPVDDWLRQGKQNVATFMSSRQVPDPFGLAEVSPTTQGPMTGTDVARSTFMTLDAPVQELQGQVRNLYAFAHGDPVNWWEPQSDLLISATTGFDDAGNGYFVDPESEVAAERRRREELRGQIGGHNVTLGRWIADGLTPFDPDTRPAMILSGLVDGAVQVYADPSALGLGKAGETIQARRLFQPEEAAGVVNGVRKMIDPVVATKFLDSKPGAALLDKIAEASSPSDVWRNLGNRKMPLSLARRLADDAHTADEVRAILEPELGLSVREVADLGKSAGPIRQMPLRGAFDAHNQDLVAFEMEAFMRNARASDEQIADVLDEVARADTPIKLNAAIRSTMSRTDGLLDAAGVKDAALRRQLTRLHADAHAETSNTFQMAFAHQGATDNPLMLGGEQQWYPGAHLINEMAPRYITLPDARAIRRLTSKYSWAFTPGNGNSRLPVTIMDAFQNEIWKPMQLMRLAWTARVVGEEQVRMAAAGLDSVFKHPLSYISWRIGNKGATDVVGDLLDSAEQHRFAMSIANGNWIDRAVVPTGVKTTFRRGLIDERDRFNDAWGSELIRLNTDPVANYVANADTFDDVVNWFTRGGGNKFRSDLAVAHEGRFDTYDQAVDYLRTVQARIDHATGGNADLLDAVRTGDLGGEAMLRGTHRADDLGSRMDAYHDAVAPEAMIGEETRTMRTNALGNVQQTWDSAVDRLFGFLMTRRTNNLSRSPTFKQYYWREVERLAGFATPELREQVLESARKAGVSSRAVKRMERLTSRGELGKLAELDDLAKGYALDATKELLYDLSRKGRFMDAARLVFPFGEAWSEVFTRWFGRHGLVASNPKVVRRFQQLAQGARGEDFGQVMGAPEGEGFFWRNEFGEEVFVYPGSALLTDKLLGVPIPLTGRVEGLSMFGSIIPGFGPVVQMPAGWILEQRPGPQAFKEFLGLADVKLPGVIADLPAVPDTVRDMVTPYGTVGAEDQGEAANPLSWLPTWMRTAFDAVTGGDFNEQQYASTIMSVAAYLRSTGRYGNSRADQQQLMEDAAFEARNFTIIKAIAQGAGPAAPSADWLLEADDREVRARALAADLRELQNDVGFAEADRQFLDAYGPDVLSALQPRSTASAYALPVTREAEQWVLENPGIEDELPNVYGFFAPQGGKFDYTVYSRGITRGDRRQLDPKVFNRTMSALQGQMRYEAALEMVGDDRNTDEGRDYLREVRTWIMDNYPGWGDDTGLSQKADTDVLIHELYDAAEDDRVGHTDAGQGLRLYLKARDQVMADAKDRGVTLAAQEMEDGRIYLNEIADWVIDRHPDFKSLFDIVLSRETEVDDAR